MRQDRNQKHRPCKQMFYLPLIPRLQRLYASQATAEHMTWHANHETEEDQCVILQMQRHGNILIEHTLSL